MGLHVVTGHFNKANDRDVACRELLDSVLLEMVPVNECAVLLLCLDNLLNDGLFSNCFRKVLGRTKCPTCGRSRKFYCYSCYHLVGLEPGDVPRIRLPVKIDMYVHCGPRMCVECITS